MTRIGRRVCRECSIIASIASSAQVEIFQLERKIRVKTVKFTELSAPLDGAVNPDTSAFGFPPYLGLPQQVQSSNILYFRHDGKIMAEINCVVVVDDDVTLLFAGCFYSRVTRTREWIQNVQATN